MKKILLTMVLWAIAGEARATVIGRLDLNPAVNAVVAREVHDGQWLAGIAKNFYNVSYRDGGLMPQGEFFHVGVCTLWNTEGGNVSFGPSVGLSLPILSYSGSIVSFLGMPKLGYFLAGSGTVLSINGFAGYRPVHGIDVNGQLTRGYSFTLSIPFGVHELQQGLDIEPQIPKGI